MEKLVAVRLGNGAKIHAGTEHDGKTITVGCSAVRHGGQLKRKVSDNLDKVTCDKCRARLGLDKAEAPKVEPEPLEVGKTFSFVPVGREVIGSSEGKKATKAQLRAWGII